MVVSSLKRPHFEQAGPILLHFHCLICTRSLTSYYLLSLTVMLNFMKYITLHLEENLTYYNLFNIMEVAKLENI